MRPVLFLDIDGVILPGSALRDQLTRKARKLRDGYLFPHEITARLNRIAIETGAQVCVSSSWRYDELFRERFVRAGFAGVYHDDWRTRTDMAMSQGGLYLGRTRGDEIAAWLNEHPDVRSWAIVDDDPDMLPNQLDRFVQTDFETGLTDAAAEQVRGLLS